MTIRHRSVLRTVAAVAAGLVALAACGGPAPDRGGDGAVSGEISLLTPIFEGADGAAVLEEQLAAFKQQYPDVTVKPDYTSYGKLNEKLTTSIASGQPYDVMLMGAGWIPPFASKGVLADLGQDPASLGSRFFERAVDAGVHEGKVYALPIMMDTRIGIYRKDLFAQAGITEPPKNFAEMREYGKRLTQRAPDGTLQVAGLDVLGIDPRQAFLTMLWAAGGELFAPDGSPAFNSPAGVNALQTMTDVIQVDRSEDVGWTVPNSPTGNVMAQGRTAMMVGHHHFWTQIQEEAPDMIAQDKLGFFVIQDERPAMFQGGTLATVAAQSKHPAAAKALAGFLASDGPALAANQQRGNIPALKSLESSEFVQQNKAIQFAMQNFDAAHSEGGVPQWLDIRDKFKPAIESAMLGQKSPQQALDDLAAEATAALAGR
ncbi:carbohydrate ABC transporter substrate-binding protein (CUT1 family) [Pseudonocardia hierapolitana]|uniref:Carbohydrate ABC transporter substrate-binding protein (CUT1 family) n=1 Tax=Pseudonocardia hierapolitana TaxID=1128676 RepID=A0A561T2F6_9PSEU|nr:ABC transporter substrate-binding protein [Pseudonocardia hierapolitana]TWF81288.1 carbohydrate ABC transporter substrate-binding protein (CUT1 family) [Pseudonocardia hierapolitana]